jgi:hypothetical protein
MSAQEELTELANVQGYRSYITKKCAYLVNPEGRPLQLASVPQGHNLPAMLQIARVFGQITANDVLRREKEAKEDKP